MLLSASSWNKGAMFCLLSILLLLWQQSHSSYYAWAANYRQPHSASFKGSSSSSDGSDVNMSFVFHISEEEEEENVEQDILTPPAANHTTGNDDVMENITGSVDFNDRIVLALETLSKTKKKKEADEQKRLARSSFGINFDNPMLSNDLTLFFDQHFKGCGDLDEYPVVPVRSSGHLQRLDEFFSPTIFSQSTGNSNSSSNQTQKFARWNANNRPRTVTEIIQTLFRCAQRDARTPEQMLQHLLEPIHQSLLVVKAQLEDTVKTQGKNKKEAVEHLLKLMIEEGAASIVILDGDQMYVPGTQYFGVRASNVLELLRESLQSSNSTPTAANNSSSEMPFRKNNKKRTILVLEFGDFPSKEHLPLYTLYGQPTQRGNNVLAVNPKLPDETFVEMLRKVSVKTFTRQESFANFFTSLWVGSQRPTLPSSSTGKSDDNSSSTSSTSLLSSVWHRSWPERKNCMMFFGGGSHTIRPLLLDWFPRKSNVSFVRIGRADVASGKPKYSRIVDKGKGKLSFVPPSLWRYYKSQLMVRGKSASTRDKYILASGGAVLRFVDPLQEPEQFFHSLLIPYVHYIPLTYSEERIRLCRAVEKAILASRVRKGKRGHKLLGCQGEGFVGEPLLTELFRFSTSLENSSSSTLPNSSSFGPAKSKREDVLSLLGYNSLYLASVLANTTFLHEYIRRLVTLYHETLFGTPEWENALYEVIGAPGSKSGNHATDFEEGGAAQALVQYREHQATKYLWSHGVTWGIKVKEQAFNWTGEHHLSKKGIY